MKHLVIFVATEFEDVELIAALDIFHRNNISFDLISVENLSEVKGKYEAIVKTKSMNEFVPENYKGLFLPGGPGHKKLLESNEVINTVKLFKRQDKFLSAICAAPEVFVKAEVLNNHLITSYPGYALVKTNTGNEVEVSGKFITGRDFKSTINFAEKLSEVLNA